MRIFLSLIPFVVSWCLTAAIFSDIPLDPFAVDWSGRVLALWLAVHLAYACAGALLVSVGFVAFVLLKGGRK